MDDFGTDLSTTTLQEEVRWAGLVPSGECQRLRVLSSCVNLDLLTRISGNGQGQLKL